MDSRRRLARTAFRSLLLGITALRATLSPAQTGSLRVRVTNAEGGPLAGAIVTLRNTESLVPPTTITANREGLAEFPILRAGSGYIVQVTFPGYAPCVVENLRIGIDDNLDLPIRMTTQIREEVEVHASREPVDLASAQSQSRFSDDFIAALPVAGRLYQNVLTLAPGVVDPDEDGNPNVHGARSRDFKAVVSGIANVDPLTGEWLSYVNPDSIEEMEVIGTGAGVEFSRAQGGFAQILQKQGGNDFEGVVRLLYASSSLDRGGATGGSAEYESLQPALQLSGPILRDKVWFRLSHERVERNDPVNVRGTIALTTVEQSVNSDQITWQASPRNKLAVQFQDDPKTVNGYGLSSRIGPDSAQRREFGGPTWSLTWTAVHSPRLLVDSLVAYQDHEVNLLPATTGVRNACLDNLIYPSLDGAQCFYTNRNQVSGSYQRASRDHRQRLTFRSQADLVAGKLGGAAHRVKLGFSAENERYFRDLTLGPDVVFTVYRGFFLFGLGTYRLSVPPASTSEVSGANWSVYAEDQIRPAQNVSVTLGLRLDNENIDAAGWAPFDPGAEAQAFIDAVARGQDARSAMTRTFTAYEDVQGFRDGLARYLQIDPSASPVGSVANQSAFWLHRRRAENLTIHNANLAPRLSIAWDPAGAGKSKLAFSAGRYYDKIFLAVPLIESEPVETYLTFFAEPRGAGEERRFVVPPYETPLFRGTINARTVDRDLRTPYQDEIALSYEHEVAPETSARITLLHRSFRDQIQDEDINHFTADYGRCAYRWPSWYVDTSRGPDGELDDCDDGGDGVPDQYVLNPGWGEILRVGNINSANYEAAVLELVHRFFRGWELMGSYTWSQATGDAEDFDQLLGNDRTTADNERGRLAYDQKHVVKLSGSAALGTGFRLGGSVRWESGLPFSLLETGYDSFVVPPQAFGDPEARAALRFSTGQRNDQDNPAFWTIDLRLSKDWTFGRRGALGLGVDAFNVLNDDALRILDYTDGTPNMVRRFGRRFQVEARVAF